MSKLPVIEYCITRRLLNSHRHSDRQSDKYSASYCDKSDVRQTPRQALPVCICLCCLRLGLCAGIGSRLSQDYHVHGLLPRL